MSSSVTVTEIGPVVLVTRSKSGNVNGKYICSSADLHMEIGQLPYASVLIGCGYSLKSPDSGHKQRAERLLEKVIKKDGSDYSNMARCSLYEAKIGTTDFDDVTSSGKLLFRGVITNGSYEYRTGSPTRRVIRLTCMSEAVDMAALPTAGKTMATGAQVLGVLHGYSVTKADGNITDACMSTVMAAYDNLQLLNLDGYGQSADLASKAAAMMACVLYAHSADGMPWNVTNMEKHIPRYYKELKDCMFSNWCVNDAVVTSLYGAGNVNSANCPGSTFDMALLKTLAESYSGKDALQTLIDVLCSDDYMLELVPHFGGSFKLELKPSCAWETSDPAVKLEKKHIKGVESAYDPVAAVKIPDVYVVSYSELSPSCTGNTYDTTTYTSGVYARNKDVRTRFRNMLSASGYGGGADDSFDETLYKVRVFNAPEWLRPCMNVGPQHDQLMNMLRSPDKQLSSKALSQMYYYVINAEDLANDIAKALFAYHYGSEDKCTIDISPEYRFGKNGLDLEDKIGELVELELSDDEDAPVNMLGRLASIHYSYATGAKACNVSYTITIDRTRTADDTFSVSCPLYVRIR